MQVHDEYHPPATRPAPRPEGPPHPPGSVPASQAPPLEAAKAPPLEPASDLPPMRYAQVAGALPPRRTPASEGLPAAAPPLPAAPESPPPSPPLHSAPAPMGETAMEPDQVIHHQPRNSASRPPRDIAALPRDSALRVDPAEQRRILLHTHGLRKVYDGRAVVDGVDVNVREREIVGLLGPNGAGKTTTFYMIVGLVQPTGGRVLFNGNEVSNEPMYRRGRMGMGYLPQEESIFRKLTVEENIMAVMETQKDGLSRSDRRERCRDLMRRFGIEKLAGNVAITLSGGEKRRLTIARSLVTNPKLLMLDEPFSGVDPIAVGEIQEIIRDLRNQGLAILITDHNVRETLGIVDRAYLLFEGTVRREGTRDFLIHDPLSRELYLGERFRM